MRKVARTDRESVPSCIEILLSNLIIIQEEI